MLFEFQQPNSSASSQTFFAEVIIPLAVKGTFTYRIPANMKAAASPGKRCSIPFGNKKIFTGIIREIHHRVPKKYNARYILDVLDKEPIITEQQFGFWQWISDYYLCQIGDVMEAALPNYLKLKSETTMMLHPDYASQEDDLGAEEKKIVNLIAPDKQFSVDDIKEILGMANALEIVRSLHQKGLVVSQDELKSSYKPKKEKWLHLPEIYQEDEQQAAIFEVLESKKTTLSQSKAFSAFLAHANADYGLKKSRLLQVLGGKRSPMDSLLKKGILCESEIEIDRWKLISKEPVAYELSEDQRLSLLEIKKGISEKKPIVFHGVTGSGKTLVYVELIEEILSEKPGQALLLVPEIALTTQLIHRISAFSKRKVALYHSKLNDAQRYELWQGIKDNKYELIVGVRSALFLPFSSLQFIIADEEHEISYKQQDPSPRYHARDAAIYLSHQLQIPIVLGSASPSLESIYNARQGKYHYVELSKRHGHVQEPAIHLIDLKGQKKEEPNLHVSEGLEKKIAAHLADKNQVILFQNRRGFAPILECSSCGWVASCQNCDVSLTYHKYGEKLSCHYCGFAIKIAQKCPECSHGNFSMKGSGTERIEDDLEILFPEAQTKRMDLDSTRRKNSLEEIIDDVESGEIDILVGTQMVTKGLDFEKVKLVGVISADSSLHIPDFRSTERTYQLLLQVAGRAGRKGSPGEVFIQTYQVNHPIFDLLNHESHRRFYDMEFAQRKLFNYPPFVRLIKVTVRHQKIEKVNLAADYLGAVLKQHLNPKFVKGPEFGASPRLKNRYHKIMHLKMLNSGNDIQRTKKVLVWAIDQVKIQTKSSAVDFIIDVDCY